MALFTQSLLPAGALVLVYLVGRIIYYGFLSPLAKVPGPFLYSVTELPLLYHVVAGDWFLVLKSLHDRYGPVVRISPHEVSFIQPETWKQVYGHKHAGEKAFPKDLRFYPTHDSIKSNLLQASDADHHRHRQLLTHAFSDRALRGQEAVIRRYTDLLILRLSKRAHKGEAVDFAKWFNFFTFDLIGDLAFGEPFGCLETSEYHSWVQSIVNLPTSVSLGHVMSRFGPLASLLMMALVPAKLREGQSDSFALADKTVKRRIASGNTNREDFMSHVLRHKDDETEKGQGLTLSEAEMVADATILIFAGSETTSTLLAATVFQLLRNPRVYDKLVQLVRETFRSEDEITIATVNRLEYLVATLTEGLRIFPPVPTVVPRLVPQGGVSMQGYWLPENTVVGVPQWAAYHCEQNFAEPESFIPERWLSDRDPRFVDDKRDVLQPFSAGPRNCIGLNLAHAESRLVLARILWHFDLHLEPEAENWDRQRVWRVYKKGELSVRLKPVERKSEM